MRSFVFLVRKWAFAYNCLNLYSTWLPRKYLVRVRVKGADIEPTRTL